MKPLSRSKVDKAKSAKTFKKQAAKTPAANLRGMPMRGGFRF
jgi:hypothetical protein